jgi:hypothetical protein
VRLSKAGGMAHPVPALVYHPAHVVTCDACLPGVAMVLQVPGKTHLQAQPGLG